MRFQGSYIGVLLDKPKSVHEIASSTLTSPTGEVIGGEDVMGHTQRRGAVRHIGPLVEGVKVGDIVRIKAGSGYEAMMGGETLQILNNNGFDIIAIEESL